MIHIIEMITNVQVSAVSVSFNAPMASVSASLLTAVMGIETALMAVMRGTAVSFQSDSCMLTPVIPATSLSSYYLLNATL